MTKDEDLPIAKMSFEQAMAELDRVVHALESGDVPLEESIRLYERGAALRERCSRKLAEAEEKVRLITRDDSGRPDGLAPLDP
ncbi:exodeoxyribonuclease VII, small subunit [Oceaniovalibus guishaninsula JLT2003]|uniref:Exodeoxyribonuclease 7 small subunit n=1 Tax=Oceaniovalibus guishaninsula JLT2003 TaxID=1231392 RepID=K2HDH6_9RHOB|nr:exodeoxyribonuclease VII small subunit [Oceaniovalibus guishaninsula]EKE44592.1 exodeoxyribonuclease VII, small subunit [Oceaniovalibus guishaninsula JLT2003]